MSTKSCNDLKRCKIETRLLWRTDRKSHSHTHFRLVSKSMTLDDLERPKRHLAEIKKSFTEPIRKIWMKIDPYYRRQNVGQWLYTMSQKKLCQCYFVNNSVKHNWPNLIIFGTRHREETCHKRPQFCPPNLNTVATLPCEMQKSYFGRLQQWIHAGYHMPAQKIVVRPENH